MYTHVPTHVDHPLLYMAHMSCLSRYWSINKDTWWLQVQGLSVQFVKHTLIEYWVHTSFKNRENLYAK